MVFLRVMHPKDAEGIANSIDPDQTAPRSSLIWVCIVCPVLSKNLGTLQYSMFNNNRTVQILGYLQQLLGCPNFQEFYNILFQCGDLWSVGVESMVVTADTRTCKVWSCGSANGVLFLEDWMEVKDKFLKFCTGKCSRLSLSMIFIRWCGFWVKK